MNIILTKVMNECMIQVKSFHACNYIRFLSAKCNCNFANTASRTFMTINAKKVIGSKVADYLVLLKKIFIFFLFDGHGRQTKMIKKVK